VSKRIGVSMPPTAGYLIGFIEYFGYLTDFIE